MYRKFEDWAIVIVAAVVMYSLALLPHPDKALATTITLAVYFIFMYLGRGKTPRDIVNAVFYDPRWRDPVVLFGAIWGTLNFVLPPTKTHEILGIWWISCC